MSSLHCPSLDAWGTLHWDQPDSSRGPSESGWGQNGFVSSSSKTLNWLIAWKHWTPDPAPLTMYKWWNIYIYRKISLVHAYICTHEVEGNSGTCCVWYRERNELSNLVGKVNGCRLSGNILSVQWEARPSIFSRGEKEGNRRGAGPAKRCGLICGQDFESDKVSGTQRRSCHGHCWLTPFTCHEL